jgi:ribosomal-protein-alanine N-acetyltransferase
MNNISPTIKGQNVLLRRPKENDILDYLKVDKSPELIRMYGGNSQDLSPKSMDEAKQFIQSMQRNKLEWAVEYEGRMIGQARLTISENDNRARYAVGLFDPTVWGKGLGTEITQIILHYAFSELKLHRVDLRVLEYNKRAIKCYEKCGFIQEGVEREGALIEGEYETDIFMSILDREYNDLKETYVQMKLLN